MPFKRKEDVRLIQAGADMNSSDVALLGNLLSQQTATEVRIKNLQALIVDRENQNPPLDTRGQRQQLNKLVRLQYYLTHHTESKGIRRLFANRGRRGTRPNKDRTHW